MKEIDLSRLDKTGLRNLLKNARDKGADDLAIRAVAELGARGLAERRDYDVYEWNQDRVRAALQPFVAVSSHVPGNRRTAYTEAGLKIGRGRDDPEGMWIDTYSAMKTDRLNAVFVAYVPRPGDQAYFELHLKGGDTTRFAPDALDDALARWRGLATEA